MEWIEVVDVIEGGSDNFENCIYMWRNKVNRKLYVGQAKDFRQRTKKHKCASFNENQKYNYNVPLHSAIRKYGIDNFEVCILEFDLNDYVEMNEKEIYYIEKYDTLANKKGYNVASGGGNANKFAGKTEEEMREIGKKMSEAKSGENNNMYGKHHSDEAKRKISENHADVSGKNNPNWGKQLSEETKIKISKARTDKKSVICVTTEKIYESMMEASRQTGVNQGNISQCCRGKLKSAGKDENGNKLEWKYLDEYVESLK